MIKKRLPAIIDIPVPPNPDVGTTVGFCVAKYEMKSNSGAAQSQPELTPWVNINQTAAKTACTSIGTDYHLMTNPEWMTIARNIEQVDSNWNGTKGTGVLARGHSDNSSGALAVTNPTDHYDGTGNNVEQAPNSGWEQRRTHTLSNGEVIWDFAGNVWEWIDWNVTPALKAQDASNWNPDWNAVEFIDLDTNIGTSAPMKPATWKSLFITATSNNGIGKYYVGNDSSGGAALRGGDWNYGTGSGVFALYLVSGAADAYAGVGFRCAWGPQP